MPMRIPEHGDTEQSRPRILLLTGEVGAGKSTAARAAVALLAPGSLGGFITHSVPENGARSVYISRPDGKSPRDAAHRIGVRHGAGRLTPFPAAFEGAGRDILRDTLPGATMLLMDELGVIESDAPCFCRDVLAALAMGVPAICVIKPKCSPFLDAVRALPDSRLLPVTKETRDALPQAIAGLLRTF